MKVITVTRSYGAGGYEAAHALAEQLGWELLDRQLLHQAAALEHLPDAELERLDEKAVRLADRFRLHPPHERYLHGLREAARQAAARGKVVLVGRGTGHLLAGMPEVFHLRLTAPREWRARRMARKEGWSFEQALARCTEEDHTRQRFVRYFFGEAPFQPARYHFIANTGRLPLEEVVRAVAALVTGELVGDGPHPQGQRLLTLTREVGAGDTGFAPTLADRLDLNLYDQSLLDQEARRMGLSEAELARIDEQPTGWFHRIRPGSLYQRYFDTLGQLMKDLSAHSNLLIAGRGSHCFLRDHPRALHVRLVAPLEIRLRRVMEHRWVREDPARKIIEQSDARRRGFYENYFGADWSDPLEYHLTVNSGLLGPTAVDLIAFLAGQFWTRPG